MEIEQGGKMTTLRGDITTRRPSSLRGEGELTGKVVDCRLTNGIGRVGTQI